MLEALLFVTAFAGMELVAILSHKYLMHGPLWIWHRSHHVPRNGVFELNDLFAVFFAALAIACIWLGTHGLPLALPVGLGMTAYGLAYFLAHDVLVHGRLGVRLRPKRGYLRRIVEAHWVHHSVQTREGCVSFGFLWAPPMSTLSRQLTHLKAVPAA